MSSDLPVSLQIGKLSHSGQLRESDCNPLADGARWLFPSERLNRRSFLLSLNSGPGAYHKALF